MSNYYLFTYNPYLIDPEAPEECLSDTVRKFEAKQQIHFAWSVQSFKKIEVDDIAIFITLGTPGKVNNGIFGYGKIIKPTNNDITQWRNNNSWTGKLALDESKITFTKGHWQEEKKEKEIHYCCINVEYLTNPMKPIIPMTELENDPILRLEDWSIRGSGYPIKNKSAAINVYQKLVKTKLGK